MKQSILICLLLCTLYISVNAQRTVGLLSYDQMHAYEGYNLFYPHNQPNVFLMNNCGEIVHTWTDSTHFRPGNTAYLQPNGDLVKTKRRANITQDRMWAGGGGAIVEIRDWDNNLKWSFELNDSLHRLHHDIAVSPEGTIFMIAWELKNVDECREAGRDLTLLDDSEMWPDYVIEVDPATDEIVWEWHAWDHLIQDLDSTKSNYGNVANDAGRIDVNYPASRTHPDWMHANAIDYNPRLDMIALSIPYFNEIWFIDHTTTTAQAASNTGGFGNIGGDLMYRWGNPEAYRQGDSTDQQLFFQHDIHWIDEYLPASHPLYDKVAVFNNRVGDDYSSANIFSPLFEMYDYKFVKEDETFLPNDFDITLTHPTPNKMYSTGLSSVQVLPNGNYLLCSGRFGYSFELTPDNDIVWEYKTPLMAGMPVEQGVELNQNANLTFRMHRIPMDFPAFDGRDLTSQGYLELLPDSMFCDSLSSTLDIVNQYSLKAFPNPASDFLTLEWNSPEMVSLAVYDALGKRITSANGSGGRHFFDTGNWAAGFHFISINGITAKVVLIE